MASRFLDILNQLHDHRVDFVIVGGVAAALHGGTRVTFDLDIVPALTPASWDAAVNLLWSLGARPRVPEPLEHIRDILRVREWRHAKGAGIVFPDARRGIDVDLLDSESDGLENCAGAQLRSRLKGAAWDGMFWFQRSPCPNNSSLLAAPMIDLLARRPVSA